MRERDDIAAHVFYSLRSLPTDQLPLKGDYLNQQLLDRGLAVPL